MPVLEVRNITKVFPGVVALDSVDIAFERGEIHCVMGENGAGKSTLIKCLTGVYEPEDGEIYIDGEHVGHQNKSLFGKVAYVPQEIDLFEHMTVAENLFLPYEKSSFKGLVNQKEIEKKALPILEKFRIKVRPDDLVRDVPISAQQLLQIARATIRREYDALILDEPTTSLTTDNIQVMFDIIREIRRENKAVVFISHKLEEIFALGDVITVLRNGKKVAYANIADKDIPWVVTQMTGRVLDQDQKFYSEKVTEEVLLEAEHLTGAQFTDISFQLKKGEILGFYGLVGAGRTELMQAIFGYLPVYTGKVRVDKADWRLGDTHYSVNNGFIYLPEERKKYGILPMLSVRENISVAVLDSLQKGLGISAQGERKLALDVIDSYDVKTPNYDQPIQFLSGGNQQKVIIGRAMCCNPKVLVFDEPTKGIDVGTKLDIYKMMKKVAEENGVGIILISSELKEVIKCSNRIVALYDGRVAGVLDKRADKEDILSAVIGIKAKAPPS